MWVVWGLLAAAQKKLRDKVGNSVLQQKRGSLSLFLLAG